jgi:hypothetical protein
MTNDTKMIDYTQPLTSPPHINWPPQIVNITIPTQGKMREFDSGATRDTAEGKLDYEGCLSPLALEAFGEYMLECSICSDGTKRPSDNWQMGIPFKEYMKSLLRHTWDVWKIHRGYIVRDRKTGEIITMKRALCALFFNVQGYLHEYLKKELYNANK